MDKQLDERPPMGARVSQEMQQAQQMLWAGSTGYAASKATGITEGAISKSVLCKKIIKTVKTVTERLTTDRESTDEELLSYFIHELEMPAPHARAWVAKRAELLEGQGGV